MFGLFGRRFFGTAMQGALTLAVLGTLPAAEAVRAHSRPRRVPLLARKQCFLRALTRHCF